MLQKIAALVRSLFVVAKPDAFERALNASEWTRGYVRGPDGQVREETDEELARRIRSGGAARRDVVRGVEKGR